MKKNILICFTLLFYVNQSIAQANEFYPFLTKQNDVIENNKATLKLHRDSIIKSLALIKNKKELSDYKEAYNNIFDGIQSAITSNEIITSSKETEYLKTIVDNIIAANPILKGYKYRVMFSKSNVQNAYAMADGSIVFNAGLFYRLANEAEVAFILCHEISHVFLRHTEKDIEQRLDYFNKKEEEEKKVKKNKKTKNEEIFGEGKKYKELVKDFILNSRRHSRGSEKEADSLAIKLLKNTQYTPQAAITCLQKLDKLNHNDNFKDANVEEVFTSKEVPFKKEWIEEESKLFSTYTEDTLSTELKEKYSTHPGCDKRILAIKDSITKYADTKKLTFLSKETDFKKLQNQLFIESIENEFTNNNLSEYLYNCIYLISQPEYKEYATYGIVRSLNSLHKKRKDHDLRTSVDKEDTNYTKNYNLLLRMLDKVSLKELATITFYFSQKNSSICTAKKACNEEWKIATQNFKTN